MRIGIIGGGLMGMSLAYFLAESGQEVVVLEQSAELGGLSGRRRFDDGLTVAGYQHAILPTDHHIRDLCARLGLADELEFNAVRTGFIHNDRIYPLATVRDFLTFPPLTLKNRVQLGSTLLRARRQQDGQRLDTISVKTWLTQLSGQETFTRIWQPLLEMKFDGDFDSVPATYVRAWMNRMMGIRRLPQLHSRVGYLRYGHYSLVQALADAVIARGGQIETQVRVREITVDGEPARQVRTHTGLAEFDAVIAAVATPTFARLIPGADKQYLAQLAREKYLGLICPVLVLDRPLSGYWTLNLTDTNSPFSSVIETPHTEHPGYYVVYLPRYTASDNDWLGVSDDDIRTAWLAYMKPIFSDFDERHIRHFAVSRSRYVEPVYSIHASEQAASVQTPYQGLYLANAGQVYPELPSSEAVVIHAEQIAALVRQQQTTSAIQIPA